MRERENGGVEWFSTTEIGASEDQRSYDTALLERATGQRGALELTVEWK